MTTLSLALPDALAKASREAAKKLGVSRTQFIRQAIIHELDSFQSRNDQMLMVKSIRAMKKSRRYQNEMEEITGRLNGMLPKDKDNWWNKQK